jgi:hypothetical protein
LLSRLTLSSAVSNKPMPRSKTSIVVAGIVASFAALAGTIIFLSAREIISFEVAKLMLVALLGMYVGFGFLIAVYLLIGKLD